jgi:histidine triad (HIT) family protein
MSTIFSKIIAGEIPCHKIYEDDRVLAFLDINPIQPGHTLIVPKVASENGLYADPEDLAHLMKVAQKIGNALVEVTGCDGINFGMNNGVAAGQKVMHTHLHVIPRFTDDGVFAGPLQGEYEDGEACGLAITIADAIA